MTFDAVTAAEDNMQSKTIKKAQTDVWCSDCRRGQYAEQAIRNEEELDLMTDAGRSAEANMQSRLSGTQNTNLNEAGGLEILP